MALTDSLDELITNGSITPQLAMKVLQQVSRVVKSQAALFISALSVRQVAGRHAGQASEEQDLIEGTLSSDATQA